MKTKVIRKPIASGLIGALATNPRRTLAYVIEEQATFGWRLTAMTAMPSPNAFMLLLSIAVLVCTLGLWTFSVGYLLAFEKDG